MVNFYLMLFTSILILALHTLDIHLQKYENRARSTVSYGEKATLVKFTTTKPKISYLFYPHFDTDAYPALQASIQVDLETLSVNYRDYRDTENRPIIHWK
ncbi:hypothetical protein [Trichormus azollae]|uniref:hypothetical protein n=1 Tax=Trichormus azollae TaxID=1164 RepID=UPI00325F35F2